MTKADECLKFIGFIVVFVVVKLIPSSGKTLDIIWFDVINLPPVVFSNRTELVRLTL